MIHTDIQKQAGREPLGGLVAAIHKARMANPEAKPLPKGFIEHSRDLPTTPESWMTRDFGADQASAQMPVFRTRALR